MLFDLRSPYAVCKELGLVELNSVNHIPVFQDPKNPGNSFYVLSKELVSQFYNPEFQYGNIVDLIVYVKGLSYLESVESILDASSDSADPTVASTLLWWKNDIALYLKDLSLANRVFAKCSKSIKIPTTVKESLINKNMLQGNIPQFLFYMSGDSLKKLISLWESKDFTKEICKVATSSDYLVYTYHTSYHTLASVVVEDIVSGKFILVYESEFAHGYLGYHTMPPDNQICVICDDITQLAHARHNMVKHSRNGYGTLLSRKNSVRKGKSFSYSLQPDRLPTLLVSAENCKVLASMMVYFKYASRVRITNDIYLEPFKLSKCCRAKVVNSFFSLLTKKSEDTESITKFMGHAFTDALIRSEIIEKLKQSGRQQVLELAGQEIIRSNKNFRALGKQVGSTVDGYHVDLNGESIPITNFTIILKRTLVFKNSSDVFYKGTAYISDVAKDVVFSKRTLQQPYEVIKVLTKALTSDTNENIKLPTIYDTRYAKYLNNILLQEANSAKAEFGLARLGWSDDRSSFRSFAWEASGFTVTERTATPHPERSFFSNYDYSMLPKSNKLKFDSKLNLILSLLVGMLCRSYMKWDIPTVRLVDSTKSRKLLIQLFEVFGQTSVLELNTNTRSKGTKIEEIEGYPVVCFSEDNCHDFYKHGVFIFCDEGLDVSNFSLNYDYVIYFKVLLPKIINHIIRTECTDFTITENNVENLAYSGAQFIRLALDLKAFTYESRSGPIEVSDLDIKSFENQA